MKEDEREISNRKSKKSLGKNSSKSEKGRKTSRKSGLKRKPTLKNTSKVDSDSTRISNWENTSRKNNKANSKKSKISTRKSNIRRRFGEDESYLDKIEDQLKSDKLVGETSLSGQSKSQNKLGVVNSHSLTLLQPKIDSWVNRDLDQSKNGSIVNNQLIQSEYIYNMPQNMLGFTSFNKGEQDAANETQDNDTNCELRKRKISGECNRFDEYAQNDNQATQRQSKCQNETLNRNQSNNELSINEQFVHEDNSQGRKIGNFRDSKLTNEYWESNNQLVSGYENKLAVAEFEEGKNLQRCPRRRRMDQKNTLRYVYTKDHSRNNIIEIPSKSVSDNCRVNKTQNEALDSWKNSAIAQENKLDSFGKKSNETDWEDLDGSQEDISLSSEDILRGKGVKKDLYSSHDMRLLKEFLETGNSDLLLRVNRKIMEMFEKLSEEKEKIQGQFEYQKLKADIFRSKYQVGADFFIHIYFSLYSSFVF